MELKDIGETIKRFRTQRGLSQTELADPLGIAYTNVSKLEAGKQGTTIERLIKISEVLKTPLSEIFALAEGRHHNEPVSEENYALVKRLSLNAECGPGSFPDDVQVVDTLAFRRDWLRRKGLQSDKLEIYEARGGSMEPYIKEGDVVMVDSAAVDPHTNEVWAIWQKDFGVRLKRLIFRENGDLIIRSDNPDKSLYPDEIVPGPQIEAEVSTLGKVVWRGG